MCDRERPSHIDPHLLDVHCVVEFQFVDHMTNWWRAQYSRIYGAMFTKFM